ncbi:MAG: hypothetical protein R2798_06920 [Chitinophagales bacterium]
MLPIRHKPIFPTSEVNFGGNCWDAIGAATAFGDVVTADVAATVTVCTDFDASAYPDFIGFDNCISYFDDNGSGDFDSGAFVTSATIYQEVAGSCVALVPTSYNIYGQPEFDNNATAGTTPGDVGSFDPTIPITFCYTYTSDGSGVANDDDMTGNIAVAYGCTQVTSVVAGTQTACNPVDNTYTQQITVTLANDPTGLTGDDVVVINGQTFTVTSNPQTFTLTGLTADGADVDVTTYMEVSSGCERLDAALFTAPAACAAVCPVVDYTTPAAVCSGDAVDFTVGAGCTGFTGSGTTGTYIDLYYYYDGTTTEAPTGYENVALPFGSTYPDPFNDGNLTPFVSDGLCLNQQDSGWTNSGCSSFIASYFAFVFDYNTDADGDGFGDYICNVYRYDVTIYPAQPSAVVTNNTACGQPTVKLVAADGTTECIADAAFGTAATAACGTGNTTVNSNGTFTAAAIATALSGTAACYVDEPYTGSSSCPNVAPAVADAGTDVSTCGATAVALGATGTGTWSGGAGTFSSTTSPTATYTPDASEIGSVVTLTWTVAGTAPCPDATDSVDVTVVTPATADAGLDVSTCGATAVALGATGTGTWSGGAGTFSSTTSPTSTYTPTVGEIGSVVTLTWTVAGTAPCPNATDDVDVTVVTPATADAGSDVNTTCTDPVALGATGIGMWSGGAGTFSDATSPTSTYTPTSGEAGTTVILTWTVMGTSPCPNATDMANVTVAACPACPDLSAAAPAAQVMNSTCSTVGGTPSGGSISAPATVCPSGSSLEYSLDNTNWSATIPTYDQDGPAQTVYTRCLCGLDGVTASPTSQVTTVPGTCPMPSFTFTIIDPCTCNNDQPADDAVLNGVGSFSETVMLDTGAGVAGAGLSIYVSAIGANMGATAPTGIAVNNLLTDNGDGTYSISFTHYDGTGYTIEVSWDQDNDDNPGTGNQMVVGVDGNRCGYPSANITAMGPYDNCAGQADVPLAATIVDGGGVGSSAWSGTGVSGTNFNPSGLTAGTATINLNYTGVDNGHVSPDNGATVVYPGCTATSSENVTINACTPACNADNGTWN